MFGTPVEHRLLDTLLQDNRQVSNVKDRVIGDNFSHPSLGAVFDGIVAAVSRGQRITLETVSDRFEEWNARGIGYADPFIWSKVDTVSSDAVVLADIVRSTFVRTEGRRILSDALQALSDGATAPDLTLTQTAETMRELVDSGASPRMTTRTLADILAEEDTYDWVIPHLLERGERLVITGAEGGGKTTLMRQLAIGAAGGVHPLTRRPMNAQRVLVVDAENSESQWRRKARWIVNRFISMGGRPDVARLIEIYAGRRMDITRSTTLTDLHRLVDDVRPDLLFIGPLYRLTPKAIQTDDEAAPLLAALDQFRDRGITLIMEAHAGKGTDSSGDRNMAPRGSSALMGWPEFGFGMRPTDPDDFAVMKVVKWRGDRDERSWPASFYRGAEADLPWMPSAA